MHSQPPIQSEGNKRENYRFGRTLGSGTFSIVRRAIGPDGEVAVKIIQKENKDIEREHVLNELSVLQTLDHPHIINFIEWFESKEKFYIVTGLAKGGDLFDKISEKGRFAEREASRTINQILKALDYLHRKDIVYRDIKPDNILYLTRNEDSDLVLADFGLAKTLTNGGEILQTIAGSLGYMAPEVMLQQGYGKPADMWAVGILAYQLLCGYLPFRSESFQGLIYEFNSSQVVFHEAYWKRVSNEARDFIETLLRMEPERRSTSQDALTHTWLADTR